MSSKVMGVALSSDCAPAGTRKQTVVSVALSVTVVFWSVLIEIVLDVFSTATTVPTTLGTGVWAIPSIVSDNAAKSRSALIVFIMLSFYTRVRRMVRSRIAKRQLRSVKPNLERTSQEEGLAPAVAWIGRAGQAPLPDLFYSS
jgi:hypothetical protein